MRRRKRLQSRKIEVGHRPSIKRSTLPKAAPEQGLTEREWHELRHLVWLRAGGCCERCGAALRSGWPGHHRKRRSQGGPDTIENVVALCGDCHTDGPDAVHHRIEAARARGFLVLRFQNPADVPIMLPDGRFALLTADGQYDPLEMGTHPLEGAT